MTLWDIKVSTGCEFRHFFFNHYIVGEFKYSDEELGLALTLNMSNSN